MRTLLFGATFLVLAMTGTSLADLVLDVTDANGNTNVSLAPGTTSVNVMLWATITGANPNGDGSGNGLTWLLSNMLVTKSAGVTNVTGLNGLTMADAFSGYFAQEGANQDINGDGILDYGDPRPEYDTVSPEFTVYYAASDIAIMYPSSYYYLDGGGNRVYQYSPQPTVSGDSTKFLLGTYRLALTGGVGGNGTINVAAQLPPYTGLAYAKALWFEDNPAPDDNPFDTNYEKQFYQAADDGASNGVVTIGTSVTFTIASRLPGDANGDGSVDGSDLNIVLSNYGVTSAATWAEGDFNGDGAVDGTDLNVVLSNYGTSSGVTSAVPEPSTLLLAAAGLAGLLAYARRKRQ